MLLICFEKISFANNDVQAQLQNIAASIRAAESQSGKIQKELDRLEAKRQLLLANLKNTQYDVVRHLSALNRLEKSPERLALLLPETSYLDYHYRMRAYQTRKDILSAQLMDNYVILTSVEDTQKAIENYIDERNTLSIAVNTLIQNIESINDNRDAVDDMVKTLNDKNMSLNQFISAIIDMPYRRDSSSPLKFSPPASGIIKTANNNEITIATALNALVTAPADGIVAYADDFGQLGYIIIINHGQGYVSVLRTFDKILIKQGLFVKSGEPLGIIKTGNNWEKDRNTPMLYYALRYNEQSINPITKFSGL